MGDEDLKERFARLDERVIALEKFKASIDQRLWWVVGLVLLYVINKLLGLLTIAGAVP